MDSIFIGTSGWFFEHWKTTFYPENIKKDEFLEYYIKNFNSVEINNTFYQLPKKETLLKWKNTAPDDFIFSVKANQFITHRKKLKDPENSLPEFFDVISVLETKLGIILFQLPPRWRFNHDRLKNFIEYLPDNFRYTFEFRDKTWLNQDTYSLFSQHNISICIYDFESSLSLEGLTADFIYLRLHGPIGAYQGQYSDKEIDFWANKISEWSLNREIFCYFDNDERGYAPQDALRLSKRLQEITD